jgi:hypothetical protein
MTEEYAQFVRVVDRVEESKAALVDAAPTGRPARVPLAEALAGFEEGLAAAELAMPAWRSNRTERVWADCRSGLEEARRRAERLRLEANPEGYEELVAVIDLLLEPLEAFRRASVWFAETPGGRWIP